METRKFGTMKDGREAKLYVLKNANGMEAWVSDLGATLVSLLVPDKDGELRDVVLGYDSFEKWEENPSFFGACIGRSGNRIGGAAFDLNGKTYKLTENDHGNNLHSGPDFYAKRLWDAEPDVMEDSEAITFSLTSPDLDQGYPGNLDIEVTYVLTESNELMIEYYGLSDQDTIFNMTNHAYFNLNGAGSGTILNHKVKLYADAFTATDHALIPTGELQDVTGTPMDFREGKTIGQDIEADFGPLKDGQGYDHNFVVNGGEVQTDAELIAVAEGDASGIVMEVYTDLPGVQMYTANTTYVECGREHKPYGKNSAVCFETQYFPDAIHHPEFPQPILKAGEEKTSLTVYRFTGKE